MRRVERTRIIEGKGLDGDRYATQTGTFSKRGNLDYEVTLIEEEALEALARDYKIELQPHESRRNLLTRGVALNHLVGKRFRVGDVELEGVKLCEPCNHLEQLVGKLAVRTALTHRGGLCAKVIKGGVIAEGAKIALV